jgi:hypothetical protein
VIAGVMPRGFKVVSYDFDLLVPAAFDPVKQQLAGFAYHGIGRLRPGVTISQADADVARLLNVWMDSWTNGPGTDSHFYETWKITPAFQPLKEQVVGSVGNVLWVVMATIGVVMLIACTNVANLLLVRADGRQQAARARRSGPDDGGIARSCCWRVTPRPAGRRSGRGSCVCGTAPVDSDWAGESAASERDLARRPVARLHLILSVLSGCCSALFSVRVTLLRGKPCRCSGPAERQVSASGSAAATCWSWHRLPWPGAAHQRRVMIRTFNAMRDVDPAFPIPSLRCRRISIPRRWFAIRRQSRGFRTVSRIKLAVQFTGFPS